MPRQPSTHQVSGQTGRRVWVWTCPDNWGSSLAIYQIGREMQSLSPTPRFHQERESLQQRYWRISSAGLGFGSVFSKDEDQENVSREGERGDWYSRAVWRWRFRVVWRWSVVWRWNWYNSCCLEMEYCREKEVIYFYIFRRRIYVVLEKFSCCFLEMAFKFKVFGDGIIIFVLEMVF